MPLACNLWAIENKDWMLDMGFREDEARYRAGNATIRKFALNIIKNDQTISVANTWKI